MMSQRREFVALVEGGSLPFAELCRRFGISRKTGYKTWRHYQAEGWPDWPIAAADRRPAVIRRLVFGGATKPACESDRFTSTGFVRLTAAEELSCRDKKVPKETPCLSGRDRVSARSPLSLELSLRSHRGSACLRHTQDGARRHDIQPCVWLHTRFRPRAQRAHCCPGRRGLAVPGESPVGPFPLAPAMLGAPNGGKATRSNQATPFMSFTGPPRSVIRTQGLTHPTASARIVGRCWRSQCRRNPSRRTARPSLWLGIERRSLSRRRSARTGDPSPAHRAGEGRARSGEASLGTFLSIQESASLAFSERNPSRFGELTRERVWYR